VVRGRVSTPHPAITGIVRLEKPEQLDDAMLVVALHDVTYVDAPSRMVAQRIYDRVSGLLSEIPFCLTVPATISGSASYLLKAEIRRSDRAALRSGDYLSTVAHPWSPGETDAVIVVRKI
jgi:uncharacterized lipoprotein YbaY